MAVVMTWQEILSRDAREALTGDRALGTSAHRPPAFVVRKPRGAGFRRTITVRWRRAPSRGAGHTCAESGVVAALESDGSAPNAWRDTMTSEKARTAGLRRERTRSSRLWTGERFENQHPILAGLRDPAAQMPSITEFIWGGERRVPKGPLPSIDPRPHWVRAPASGLRATCLGHSTVLIEIDGLRELTDPVWGRRASPSQHLGPKRFQPVPVAVSSLPSIDVVVISHDHYDHLDYVAIRELIRTGTPFVTPLGMGARLEAWGVPSERITELDWWESWTLPGADLTVTAAPAQHFSGRGLRDRNSTLWASLAIRSSRHSAFFSGDTGLTTEYATIRDRLGPFDLVMLEVGAFHPSWGHLHLGPATARQALDRLGGGAFLPGHWGTFALAIHDWDEPVEDLLALAPAHGARLLLPRLGDPVEPRDAPAPTPWWRSADDAREQRRGGTDDSPATTLSIGEPID